MIENALIRQVLSLPELIEQQYNDLEPKARKALTTPEIFGIQRIVLTGCGDSYAAALATENVTAEDDPVTLVSVDPERLCFLPVQGDATENAKAVQSTGTIYQWNMVAAGVSDGSDFILWGYSGVDTYRLEDAEFTRAQEVWEMPCGTEGTCAVIVPDGRILYIGATGGVQGQTAAGVDISGKDPAKTYFYYEPLK